MRIKNPEIGIMLSKSLLGEPVVIIKLEIPAHKVEIHELRAISQLALHKESYIVELDCLDAKTHCSICLFWNSDSKECPICKDCCEKYYSSSVIMDIDHAHELALQEYSTNPLTEEQEDALAKLDAEMESTQEDDSNNDHTTLDKKEDL